MNIITVLKNSRDEWKRKAIERGATARGLKKRLQREQAKRLELESVIVQITADLEILKRSETSAAVEVQAAPSAMNTRATCVLLGVVAVIPFRSVPRVLKVMHYPGWIPHFTSVINWTLRVGLFLLREVKPAEAPWIAIIDMSIDVAVKKVLVVLRVPMDALAKRGAAIELEDCECIGVQVATSWKGPAVCSALKEIFSKSGNPAVILKDGGTDLSSGVRLWKAADKQNRTTLVADDIGHMAANGLKADFSWTRGFKNFLKSISAGALKLRQSELAYLTPPKVRTKGRFQGITKLAEWAVRIIPLLGSAGQVQEDSFTGRLRELLGGLGRHRLFLLKFTHACHAVQSILKIAKNSGINQKSYVEIKTEILRLPLHSKTRKKLLVWLERHITIQCRLSMGQIPLMVSSDIIESLMGKFKVVLMRNPKAEFNRIILAIPTLCNGISAPTVVEALETVTHGALTQWERQNVQGTQNKMKRKFNAGLLKPDPVPYVGLAA